MDTDHETTDIASLLGKRRGSNFFYTWALFFFVALASLSLISLWIYAHQPASQTRTTEAVVSIPAAAGFNEIQQELQKSGIIQNGLFFRLLADILGITEQLKAGEYRFSTEQTPFEILKKMERGEVVLRQLTIPEGLTLAQINDILVGERWINSPALAVKTDAASIAAEYGIHQNSLEGYLFPDTYHITKGLGRSAIIQLMIDRMHTVLLSVYGIPTKRSKIDFSIFPAVKRRGVELTLHEVLTLASIVEKETAQSSERPLIAAVFLNRLRRGMRLQADPTVIYGISSFSGNLTKKDLRTITPYNTYRINGLPPGPIANPGKAAIEAVLLTPSQFEKKYPHGDWQSLGKYVYFVSKNDGSHIFSKSLAEHNRAVSKYQKGK